MAAQPVPRPSTRIPRAGVADLIGALAAIALAAHPGVAQSGGVEAGAAGRSGGVETRPAGRSGQADERTAPIRTEDLQAFRPRSIGPAVTGGRIHDVEALPEDPSTIFVATASGGLWKTTNRGQTWTSVFDAMAVSTFGDVAVAPSDPDVLYAGTGEQQNRQSTSWGNGVYRSDDGGESWRHVGLEETRHVAKVVVHPDDPDVAWVAAGGNLWKGSEERGVYRTTDRGRTWTKVLAGENRWTGAIDLEIDPSDPDVLYAATYQRLRRTWGFNGGGPGSGIYKTTDGGDGWTELTDGIPAGAKGRIGIAIARSDPRVLSAVIEHHSAEGTGTYRTEDGGESWSKVNDLDPRPMYYSHIYIDPTDAERVYVLSRSAFRSGDGGASFEEIALRPTYDTGVHSDHHDLWIDPNDPEHLYLVGDAGLHESYDRGLSFRRINNFAIGQFYAIGVDMRDPYRIYGGMQDNHSWMGPSRTRRWMGIPNDEWKQVGFGDGMYWQIDPTNHRNAYGNAQNGEYTRFDPETGEILPIEPLPPEDDEEYRFDWVSPSLVSAHDPRRIYVGGNRLFVSEDRGESWRRTEDLSRAADRDTLELMGVRGADIRVSRHDGTSSYGEITTIAESPLDGDVLWVGTDDGNVQVSRDRGRTWTEVARNVEEGVTDGTYVSRVVASASARGTAYATFDAHRDGDFAPYVVRTTDFGRSWEPLAGGLPSGSVNVLVEHPDDPDVLFLGTEHSLFVSTDAGRSWAKMPNLPTTLYDDLVVHPREKDLVIGTHGRSIWILDDTRPLAEWDREAASAPLHLFSVRPARVFTYWKSTSYRGQAEFYGENPADGALITYRVSPGAAGSATLEVRAPDGTPVRRMRVPGEAGVHRVNWDLRHGLPSDTVEVWQRRGTAELPRSTERQGPFVVPGTYRIALRAGGEERVREVRVELDPAMADRVTRAQLEVREAYLLDLATLARRLDRAADEEEGSGSTSDPQGDEVERLRQRVLRLYDALNGQAVQPGSLHPPTDDQIDRKRELEERARELLGGA